MAAECREHSIDELVEVAKWYKELHATNNTSFMPLFADESRYLVLKGGGGSGKSIFAGRKWLERAVSEPNHRILVCRKVAKTLRESCFNQLVTQAKQYYPDSGLEVNKTDMSLQFASGSKFIMAGLDDVEKLKSIHGITGIWIEEASELQESDFNQLDIRLRGEAQFYKQIILTFNPVSIMHWLKKRFFDRHDPRARTHNSTYKDNRFLPDEDKQTLEDFKATDPYYYTVYCLGEWGVTGNSVFNAEAVSARLSQNIQPQARGYFEYSKTGETITDYSWVDDRNGFIKLYEQPEECRPYVIGGDTAGEGSDFFAAQVIDNITTKQVCVLHHQFDEDLYADQMYCLGKYYNTALLAPEANFSSYVVKKLQNMKYPKLYVREREDTFTHRITKSYGVQTTSKTRPIMISNLVQTLREDISLVQDRTTLEEMLTFVRNESFRAEAEAGAHDDLIMALAIAHYARGQQTAIMIADKQVGKRWHKDLLEDYDRAKPEMQQEMIKIYGEPVR